MDMEPEVTDEQLATQATETDSDRTYTVLSGGESVFDIAMKVGLKVPELMEHNGLKEYSLAEGAILHLPYAPAELPKDNIEYTIYPEVKIFHVSKSTGARKYAFGNAKQPKHITPIGPTNKQYKTVRIAGHAILNFGSDRYGYYLDELVVKNGAVEHNYGFPFEFLTEGEPPEEPEKHTKVTEMQAFLATIEPTDYDTPQASSEPATSPQNATKWRSSYTPYDTPQYMRTIVQQDVFDFGGKKPVKLHFYGKVWIAGEFKRMDYDSKEIITYCRPLLSVENLNEDPNWQPSWYGINRDNMEFLDRDIPTPEPEQDYEVTMPDTTRSRIYKGAELFRPAMRVAAHSVKLVDSVKKQFKEKV